MLENLYCFGPYQPGEKGESELTPAEFPKDVESLTRFSDLEPRSSRTSMFLYEVKKRGYFLNV
jgi:hypothetical protein